MRKLGMQIAVVLLLFVGVSTTGNPRIQSSGTSVAQTVASQSTLAPMQTFTSADGRFSILFPGAVKQESQNINLKNGEVTKLYEFSADDDDGNTSYIVMYNDYAADVVNTAPQTLLMRTRDGAVAGKTLLTDVEFSLSGVPGRAYTASDPDGWQYDVHEFLSGVRFYQLIITTGKGHTATRRDQFMNSFRIL